MKVSELISTAAAEVGYVEKASNSKLDDSTANAGSANWTKYARDLYKAGYYNGNKNGFAWCAVFVAWCFWTTAGNDKAEAEKISCQSGDLGAVCTYAAMYYKAQGRLDGTPSVGDQVFFGNSDSAFDHTGIVEKVTDTQIYTIEGNSSDKVCRRIYSLSNSWVRAFGHPLYDDSEITKGSESKTEEAAATSSAETAEATEREDMTIVQINTYYLQLGSRGNTVQNLQLMLNHWEGAGLEIDGSFGRLTQTAVRTFQQKCGLEVDGIVGKNTWAALLNHT